MRLPWKKAVAADRLVVSSFADAFVYAQADFTGRLRRCGAFRLGSDTAPEFARRVRALGLPSRRVCAVLAMKEGQLIQIEAPAVKPEEMKAAARWRIKEQIDGRLDDLTIDVLVVGDERPRPTRHLFVAAARTATIKDVGDRTRAVGLDLTVIDLAETAQRNLQSSLADLEGLGERATAALVRHGDHCLLTICANHELFYARRLAWEGLGLHGVVQPGAGARMAVNDAAAEAADFVDYGAEANFSLSSTDDASRLVIDLQRSFDVWERSWPDLPLAAFWVQVGEESAALAALLEPALGQRVGVLDAERVFPGFEQAVGTPDVRAAVLPILGALLRSETRRV